MKPFNNSSFNINHGITISILLVFSVIFIYFPVVNYPFLLLDDDVYVYENLMVKEGLTAKGIQWAFSFDDHTSTYWHPLVWISLMMDAELFGLDPGGYHAVNVLIHLANCLLLFWLLKNITGCLWRSGFVAILFAIHPVNIESVVWIAERKNVLSTFFWLLTLFCYSRFLKNRSCINYILIVFVYILGLISKPMLITLPFVLLLIDYWPLKRFSLISGHADHGDTSKSIEVINLNKWLIVEKAPLFFLSFLTVFISNNSLKEIHSWISYETVPLSIRCANAVVSTVQYIFKLLLPVKLSILYPFPYSIPSWQVLSAAFMLLLLTWLFVFRLRNLPYLVVGWFWYLGTLVPVSGIVQAGLWPSMADRWLYVPQIGLFIILVWGGDKIFSLIKSGQKIRILVMVFTVVNFTYLSFIHIQNWRDNVSLFHRSLQNGAEHPVIYSNYGAALLHNGEIFNAIDNLKRAVSIDLKYTKAFNNLGVAFSRLDRLDEAEFYFNRSLSIDKDFLAAKNNLTTLRKKKDAFNVLIKKHFQELETNPFSADTLNNIGYGYLKIGEFQQAITYFQKSIMLDSAFIQAYNNLGIVYMNSNKPDDAAKIFLAALKIDPEYSNSKRNLLIALSRIAKD